MANAVWAVITETKCDGDFDFDSFFSLFSNYDDALAEFKKLIEEETELMSDDDDDTWTDEGDEADGAKWWYIESDDSFRFSKVFLRAVEVA